METHAHLGADHPDKVETKQDGETSFVFVLKCPECDSEAERRINPRGRDPEFLEEFDREIRLVAFDMLLYHMQADHPESLGLPPHSPPAATDGGEGDTRVEGSV
jgi:hypothetical protein